MDVVFGNSLGNPRSGDDDDYTSLIHAFIANAVDHEESYLGPRRQYNTNYYMGNLPNPPGSEESQFYDSSTDPSSEFTNRSSITSTDVRDTILTILPSLMRIFANDEHVVFYAARSEEGTEGARQCTDYAGYVFWNECDGFLSMHNVIKDALTVKLGILHVTTIEDTDMTEKSFGPINEAQYQYLLSERPDMEVLELETDEFGLMHCTVRYQISKPKHMVTPVPPEEFRISKEAKSHQTARLIGWERQVPMSDLVKEGYDEEWDLEDYISGPTLVSDERYLRNPALIDIDDGNGILRGLWFIRVDADGDGIEELRRIETIGNGYEIISDYIVDDHEFALFGPDPRPHTVVGDCPADLVIEIQKLKTNMSRANIDNLAESNNPKTVVNELLTNMDDVLNDEVGAVIRTRGNPNDAVAYTKTPYVGEEILLNLRYLDEVRASRTGITEASKGLDPKALQSTALSGIDAIVSGAQERIELIARILAETGFKRLYTLLLRNICRYPSRERTLYLRGKWVDIKPSTFDEEMNVEVNPTLGKGTDIIRLQALQEVKQTQMTIIEKFGPSNPLCGPMEFANTLIDVLAIANIKDTTRYFKQITPEIMQAIEETPIEPDPTAVIAKAEMEKVKKDMVIAQSNQQLKIADQRLAEQKHKADDDFRRDKLRVDTWLEAIELAMAGIEEVQAADLDAMNQPAE